MKKFLSFLFVLLFLTTLGITANASSFIDTLDEINDTLNTVDRTEYTLRRIKNKVPDVNVNTRTPRTKVITVPVNNTYQNPPIIQQNVQNPPRRNYRQNIDYYENDYTEFSTEQPVLNNYEQNKPQKVVAEEKQAEQNKIEQTKPKVNNTYNSTSSYTIPKYKTQY